MTWTIKRIDECDFGCEERMPGEPLMVLVTLENEEGSECQFEVADQWLLVNDLNEGDEWPEDIEASDEVSEKSNRMSEWMDNYFEALAEMEENR